MRRSEFAQGLPPVLFSLPDVSLQPRHIESPGIVAKQPALQPSSTPSPVAQDTPKAIKLASAEAAAAGNSGRLLNSAIVVLATAFLLIMGKLAFDRGLNRGSPVEPLGERKAPVVKATVEKTNVEKTSVEQAAPGGKREPAPKTNQQVAGSSIEIGNPRGWVTQASGDSNAPGPQTASYVFEVAGPNRNMQNSVSESNTGPVEESEIAEVGSVDAKPVLEISDAPETLPEAPKERLAQNSPMTYPIAKPEPLMAPAGTANSLNTRDMILLRQGKPIDLQAKEPVRGNTSMVQPSTTSKPKSGTMLNGESYPPIKQKYEPISLPLPKNPSSIEIPPPPKPYQPIGAQFE